MEADVIRLASPLTGLRIVVQSPFSRQIAVVSYPLQRLEVASPITRAVRVTSVVALEEIQP